jgi:hypothetical protein
LCANQKGDGAAVFPNIVSAEAAVNTEICASNRMNKKEEQLSETELLAASEVSEAGNQRISPFMKTIIKLINYISFSTMLIFYIFTAMPDRCMCHGAPSCGYLPLSMIISYEIAEYK